MHTTMRYLIPLLAAAAAFQPGLAAAHHEGVVGTEAWAGLAAALVIGLTLVLRRRR